MQHIEQWRPIPDYEGYEASSDGRIRSWRWQFGKHRNRLSSEPRIKATRVNENGYEIVSIGHSSSCRVHVLVAAAFIAPKIKGMDVNHIDGNKLNNRADNLEYLTRADNHRHAFRLGLAKSPFTGRVGEKHFLAKLKDADALDIRRKRAKGVNARDLAAQYGVSRYTIWDVASRRTYKHLP